MLQPAVTFIIDNIHNREDSDIIDLLQLIQCAAIDFSDRFLVSNYKLPTRNSKEPKFITTRALINFILKEEHRLISSIEDKRIEIYSLLTRSYGKLSYPRR